MAESSDLPPYVESYRRASLPKVLEFLTQGYLYKEIAEKLNVGVPTVATHIRRIYEKLHVQSRSQAVAKYLSRTPGVANSD